MTPDGLMTHATLLLVEIAPHCRSCRFSDIGATPVPGRNNAALCNEVGPEEAVYLRNGKRKSAFRKPR